MSNSKSWDVFHVNFTYLWLSKHFSTFSILNFLSRYQEIPVRNSAKLTRKTEWDNSNDRTWQRAHRGLFSSISVIQPDNLHSDLLTLCRNQMWTNFPSWKRHKVHKTYMLGSPENCRLHENIFPHFFVCNKKSHNLNYDKNDKCLKIMWKFKGFEKRKIDSLA